ncbi:WbqC family protein [Aeromonas sp. 601027]|uniref:WbqC family protein n=1 Tax=unclassified Aeromonas TaxID=257493 RepID=UPI003BA15FAE
MHKKIAIIQSNYIPWIGYFDIINRVDEFIFLDSVQYTTRDWRNRNRIMTTQGAVWLTIPVCHVDRNQKISSTKVVDNLWCQKHFAIIKERYKKALFFDRYIDEIKSWYEDAREFEYISDINIMFIKKIMHLLGITTPIFTDSHYLNGGGVSDATERLIVIAERADASIYFSGPAAKNYLDIGRFEERGIGVAWMEYPEYARYPQNGPGFDCRVSIIDALLCAGGDFVHSELNY